MKTIKIKCKAADAIAIDELNDFQGNLKILSKENLQKLTTNILDYGFSAPIFVWRQKEQNFVLDGKQRISVLLTLRARGYEIPPLPVVYIEAKSKKEAKRKLLAITSQFGKIQKSGLEEYLLDSELMEEDIIDEVDLVGITLRQEIEEDEREEKLKPFKKTHILLSFTPGLFSRIKPHLEKILRIEGVEYEQGSN